MTRPGDDLLARALAAFPVLTRALAAFPDLQASYDAKRRELIDEGLGDHIAYFVLEEYTTELKSRAKSNDTGRREFAEWLTFFEQEWGVDPETDTVIHDTVLVFMPDAPEDIHGLRSLLGPQLAAQVRRKKDYRAFPEYKEFVADLLHQFPELRAYVAKNTAGDHGEVLPHCFTADVARHTVRLHLSTSPADRDRAHSIIAAVVAAHGHNPVVDGLIELEFIDTLPYGDQPGADIVRLLPPHLMPT